MATLELSELASNEMEHHELQHALHVNEACTMYLQRNGAVTLEQQLDPQLDADDVTAHQDCHQTLV